MIYDVHWSKKAMVLYLKTYPIISILPHSQYMYLYFITLYDVLMIIIRAFLVFLVLCNVYFQKKLSIYTEFIKKVVLNSAAPVISK